VNATIGDVMRKCNTKRRQANVGAALLCAGWLAAGNATQARAEEVYDPIEPANRVIFTFNKYVDMVLVKPVAQAYDYVIPDPGKTAVSNVLNNLTMPVVFVNSVLQGDAENSFESLWSFILNTTFGIGGLFDFVGANTDLTVNREDFGQTLGSWGLGSGPYLVLPLLGPSSIRDTFGIATDYAFDPYTYLDSDTAITIRTGLTIVDARYQTLALTDDIYENSLDPYVTFRSGYAQRRNAQIANTKSSDMDEE
jgi:phospholipid-binding lipoprotein MlaA